MKIINIENGKKKIYIQEKDLRSFVVSPTLEIPRILLQRIMTYSVHNLNNSKKFIEFDDPIIVEFLDNIDWIVDFRTIYNLSYEEFVSYRKENIERCNNFLHKYNESLCNGVALDEAYDMYKLYDYKVQDLVDILNLKKGLNTIDLPCIPDFKGFHIEDSNNELEAYQTLNPLRILIRKKNGDVLNIKDEQFEAFVKQVLNQLIKTSFDSNDFFNDKYRIIKNISEDKKSYIVTLRTMDYEAKYDKDPEENKVQKNYLIKNLTNFFKKRKN